ncbi:hypothetical protein SJAV_07610 [Sulfurisphaera javensis]|uniref:Transposase n=1 Tax=Sulfurisphaera javensis TaxID=2049879 RepID=A0AAT9GPU1_9CREN
MNKSLFWVKVIKMKENQNTTITKYLIKKNNKEELIDGMIKFAEKVRGYHNKLSCSISNGYRDRCTNITYEH